jgi:hypothetical protein
MASRSGRAVSVFQSLVLGIMAAASTTTPVWQCDTGNGKWCDYPVQINEKLEALNNNTNALANQAVVYVWKGDDNRPDVEFEYRIFAKASPFPIQINFKTNQIRQVRRILLQTLAKEAAPAIQREPGQKRLRE